MTLPVFGPKNRKFKYRDLLMFTHYKSDDKVCMYRITDKYTGMSYIGQTTDTIARLRTHRHTGPFSILIQNKGYTSIRFEILEDDIDVENADDRERHYVNKFNTLEPEGYNKITGGKKDGKVTEVSKARYQDGYKRRDTSRKLNYDERINKLLPQFKLYTDEYKGYGSRMTIMNLMNIPESMYYKLLKMSE